MEHPPEPASAPPVPPAESAQPRVGRYEIVRELGRGAMGIVFLAVDPAIGRQVAIKTIRLDAVDDPDERAKLRERLFREARSAGILSHPGIVTIYDMEERGDTAFIAMEFVDGPTLDQLMSSRQPLPADRLLSILRQTASALDYAHGKGIVHRDIKPANVMIAADGAIKITDFGIAKVTTSQQYTQTGTIVGTPNYMSPEQVQGLAVSGRADQFSLAVIAYEMLTGERPFTGEHLTTVVYKIVAEEPPPAQRLNPTLGQQIDGTLRRGLMKKPEARYVTCVEFVAALEAACNSTAGWKNLPRGGSMSLPTVVSDSATTRIPPGAGTTTEEAILGRRSSRSRWLIPFAAALVVALGLIGLIALQFGGGFSIGRSRATPEQSSSSAPETAAPPAAAPTPAPETTKPSALQSGPAVAKSEPQTPPSETKPVETKPAENPSVDIKPDQTSAQETAAAPPGATKSEEQPPEIPQNPPREKSVRKAARAVPPIGPQTVLVTSEPAGATAALDGNSAVTCKTPCMLNVMPGRHTVSLTRDGYQRENREVVITDSPAELPLVNLRKAAGLLMVSSTPTGASIYINDQLQTQTTPAQISLGPGTYNVRVEKNGVKQSSTVDIRTGMTNYMRFPLQ